MIEIKFFFNLLDIITFIFDLIKSRNESSQIYAILIDNIILKTITLNNIDM